MKDSPGTQQVAFLDTNTLHYIRMYLDIARRNRLYPFTQHQTSVSESTRHLRELAEKALRTSLGRGLRTVRYLLKNRFAVRYAAFSELELIVGRIKGIAVESLAKEGVPDRFWGTLGEAVISKRVSATKLSAVQLRVGNLSIVLQDIGISANSVAKGSEILDLARAVLGLAYMSVGDSVVYSSAISAQADYLISWDGYFRTLINDIHSPGSRDHYKSVRLQLCKVASDVTLLDLRHVILPRAFNISSEGKPIPDLPSKTKR